MREELIMGNELTITGNGTSLNISMIYVYIILGVIALLFVTSVVLLIVVLVKQNKLTKKYNEFIKGSDAKSMEDAILKRFKDIDKLLESDAKKEVIIKEINENLSLAVQKVGIVKYDAFKEMGGKLSFALSMLDKNNTGFVINAMHSREGCYTYIKEIIKGESFVILAAEERRALEEAKSKGSLYAE